MQLVKITRESRIPLIGHIAFGIVLRPNSNVIQVRATTICNMNCPFCSTDAGPFSTSHITHYIVDPEYMVDWIKKVIQIKGKIHVNIDSIGEPTTYPYLVKLISLLKKEKEVVFISMQTNGTFLTKDLIEKLNHAGLNRIHVSIHSLDAIKSKKLFGSEKYEMSSIQEAIGAIKKTNIELLFAPVWIPDVNDKDVRELIQFAKGKKCRIAIQKYEEYKYSRKMKEAGKINYYKFYKQLRAWEKEFEIQLVYRAPDLNTERAANIPETMKINETLLAEIVAPGWLKGQMIAAARDRCITVVNCGRNSKDKVKIRITENKSNIYLAEMVQ